MVEVTGTEVIRAALRAKNKKINLAGMARDLGLPTSTLEDFAENRRRTLAPDTLQKIVGYIWTNGTTFDAARDLLVPPNVTPTKFATVIPPRWDGPKRDWSKHKTEGATEVSPKKSKPSGRFTRPGWLSW